jgi:RNA polymerase sigma-70 factor (ECF subfamily)
MTMSASLHSVPAGPDEGALVAERRQFEDFFLAEHDRLYRALCLVTGSRDEAEEVLQDAFLRLWERWDRIRDVDDPRAYLYRTAMNAFRSRYRSASRRMKRVITARPPDDAFALIEERDVVVRALRQLIPQQRAAIVLTGLLDYTSEEAGRMLGMKASTVRALSTRAREAMRTKVGELP